MTGTRNRGIDGQGPKIPSAKGKGKCRAEPSDSDDDEPLQSPRKRKRGTREGQFPASQIQSEAQSRRITTSRDRNSDEETAGVATHAPKKRRCRNVVLDSPEDEVRMSL